MLACRNNVTEMWHSVCTYERQVVLIFPGWLMRSGFDRDGVKWGFAGKGSPASADEPFRYLGLETSVSPLSFPIGNTRLLIVTYHP
jgi:hypothetical protein